MGDIYFGANCHHSGDGDAARRVPVGVLSRERSESNQSHGLYDDPGQYFGYFYEQGSSFWEINTRAVFTMWVVTIAMGIAFFDQRLSVVLRGLLLGRRSSLTYDRFGVRLTWLARLVAGNGNHWGADVHAVKKAFAIFLVALRFLIVINFAYLHAAFDAERAESGLPR